VYFYNQKTVITIVNNFRVTVLIKNIKMNTIIKKVLLLNFIFIITTSLSAQNWFSGNKKVKGNGVLLKEVREVPNYKEISIGGSFEVVLVSGKQGKIDIEAEENLMAYITTEVTDRVLKINFKKHTNINATKKNATFDSLQRFRRCCNWWFW